MCVISITTIEQLPWIPEKVCCLDTGGIDFVVMSTLARSPFDPRRQDKQLTLSSLVATFVICWLSLQTVWNQVRTYRMLFLVWIYVWHSDSFPERIFHHFFCCLLIWFKIHLFKKFFLWILSEYQTVWIQIRPSSLSYEPFSYEKMHKTLLILLLIFKYFILNEHRIQSNLGGWF